MTPAAWRGGAVAMTAVPLGGEVEHERARVLVVTGGKTVSRKTTTMVSIVSERNQGKRVNRW